MESRKITVVSTKTQKKSVIMSGAETLAELKNDLNEANIDYDGMTFYEGLSKTELKSDNSQLPKNISYKGATTNELVFMLTNTNKRIKSGVMTRAEAYAAIKAKNLQKECIIRFGRSYTQVKTTDLISLLDTKSDIVKEDIKEPVNPCVKKEEKDEVKNIDTFVKQPVDTTKQLVSSQSKDIANIKKAIRLLVDYLEDDGYISICNAEEVIDCLEKMTFTDEGDGSKQSDPSPYSEDEISSMFDFV